MSDWQKAETYDPTMADTALSKAREAVIQAAKVYQLGRSAYQHRRLLMAVEDLFAAEKAREALR